MNFNRNILKCLLRISLLYHLYIYKNYINKAILRIYFCSERMHTEVFKKASFSVFLYSCQAMKFEVAITHGGVHLSTS